MKNELKIYLFLEIPADINHIVQKLMSLYFSPQPNNHLGHVGMYDFEAVEIRRFLRRHGGKLAAIQLPAGLRPYLPEIDAIFVKAGVETRVLADSCYGACDVADARAKQLGCDVLVHFGHADMGLPTLLPTLYVEARVRASPLEAIKGTLAGLRVKHLGLLTTVQHVWCLEEVAGFLRSRRVKPLIGGRGPRAKYPGQLLGCDFSCARSIAGRVESFLYLGTGYFHPLGAALATGKRVFILNPVSGGLEEVPLDLSDFLRGRKAMISKAAAGERFGVLVSSKPGQARFKLAAKLVEDLRRSKRDSRLLVVDEVEPEGLEDFELDAFVCAACPRIPIDDAERFERPILTPFEAQVMLGKAKFGPYRMDEVNREDFG